MSDQPAQRFVTQWYQSEESSQSPYAPTPDEALWAPGKAQYVANPGAYITTMEQAILQARDMAANAGYRTCRVVELNENMDIIGIIWLTHWVPPQTIADSAASGTPPGVPGESIKVLVWMDRDTGPPQHWHFETLKEWQGHNANAWDLVYGREVDRRGRMILWSIRLNVWPNYDAKPLMEWDWWKIFGYNKKRQPDMVEPVRAYVIEPRHFPQGVDTIDCSRCSKTIEKQKAWWSYVGGYMPEEGDTVGAEDWGPYCSCYCIDETHGLQYERDTPDGERLEPDNQTPFACEFQREKALV